MAHPDWASRGKTIQGLIKELQSFEDQTLEVRISSDGGVTSLPISLVVKEFSEGMTLAVLQNFQDEPMVMRHVE